MDRFTFSCVLICHLIQAGHAIFQNGRILIHDLDIEVESEFNNNLFVGRLGNHMTSQQVSQARYERLPTGVRITWSNQASLTITDTQRESHYDVTCQDFAWMADDCRMSVFEDCYAMEGANWYGGAPINDLTWPIEKWDRSLKPFVSGDAIGSNTTANSLYGGVLERYWLNSDGVGIQVDSEVPLWISLNSTGDQQLCFRATYEDSPYMNYDDAPLFLNYTICQGANVKETQMYAIENFFSKPFDIPDEKLFRYPIYSTWARYHANVTQELVIEFANEINYHNYSNAQMEIDDDWESSYGRLDFNPEKFPDPQAMVSELSDLGFRTTIWVHPFVNLASTHFWAGGLQFVYLRDPGGILPGLTLWWRGVASTIDFTNSNAVDWWTKHLVDLRENYNISSFKFDAGETNWLPASYVPSERYRNPCDYTNRYVETAYLADADVRHQEVRAAYRNQNLPIFSRLLDKYSQWDYDNGLRTVIPNVLLFSIIGYVFPLPDMIGGNAYGDYPDRELFIRWTQLNTFLPRLPILNRSLGL